MALSTAVAVLMAAMVVTLPDSPRHMFSHGWWSLSGCVDTLIMISSNGAAVISQGECRDGARDASPVLAGLEGD